MKFISSPCALLGALLLAACGGGDDSNSTPDANTIVSDARVAPDAAPQADAPVNSGDCFTEANDSGNSGFSETGEPELSGQSAGGGINANFCGNLDQSFADGEISDSDWFLFDVTEGAALRLELWATGGNGPDSVTIELVSVDAGYVGGGLYTGDHGVFVSPALTAGQFIAIVTATGTIASPIAYRAKATINGNDCVAAMGTPTFSEADESGAGHRANDVVAVDYANEPVGSLTAAADNPEATGVTVAPASTTHLQGNSADVAADGDEYLDRDTFLVATDATTNEIEIRLTWPNGDSDMDIMVYDAESVDPERAFFAGTLVDTNDDELFTLSVEPNSNYWVWVGNYDDTGIGGSTNLPFDYDVTICARQVSEDN